MKRTFGIGSITVFALAVLFCGGLQTGVAAILKPVAAAKTLRSPLVSFNWSGDSKQGFSFYTDINTDHGDMGGGFAGLHGYSINADDSGLWEVWADQGIVGSSWHGRWISLAGLAGEKNATVNILDPLPHEILDPYRIKVTGLAIRLRGTGRWKVEIKYPDNSDAMPPIVYTTDSPEVFIEQTVPLPDRLTTPVKLLNIVVESQFGGSHLWFDSVDFICSIPPNLRDDPLLYGALVTYTRLLACLNDDGTVRDHLNFPAGDFDSVPAIGFQIYAAACAADLGFISEKSAADIARRCSARLLKVPRHKPSGLLPHFLRNRAKHPDSEWSSVDTALALVPAALGLEALGEEKLLSKLYRKRIDPIRFDLFTNGENRLTHGFSASGAPLTGTWNEWNSELVSLLLLRALQNPSAPLPGYDVHREFFAGRAFLTEMAALWAEKFAGGGKDRNGIDWNKTRRNHLKKQRNFATSTIYWGLDPVEIMRWDTAQTQYLEGGVGTNNPQSVPLFTLEGYGAAPWFAPHYSVGMAADLDPKAVAQSIVALHDHPGKLFPPLCGPPESIQVEIAGASRGVVRWHRVVTSLNGFFTFAGLYKGICSRDGRSNVIHVAGRNDQRLAAALESVH